MKAIVHGVILLPEGEVRGRALLYDQRIVGIVGEEEARAAARETIDAEGAYVAPGLIDTHTHGLMGADASDGQEEGIRRIAHGMLQAGVTSFLPTTDTKPWERLQRVFEQIRRLREESRQPAFPGAEILGCHAEGPFINLERKGAMEGQYAQPLDADKMLQNADVVRLVTFAPELPGGASFIRTLREKTDMTLSMGHSNASYDQAMAAIHLGVSRATHLFNAMSPLHHREPGVVGAALASDIFTELIADTYHVSPALYPMLIRAKGNKLVLITDSVRFAGMPEGEYQAEGETFIRKGLSCRLRDGTIAGSVLKLNEGVRNLRDWGGVPLHTAVRAASLNAAESIGLKEKKGSLAPGKDADILLMDRDCRVLKTIVGGSCKYSAK